MARDNEHFQERFNHAKIVGYYLEQVEEGRAKKRPDTNLVDRRNKLQSELNAMNGQSPIARLKKLQQLRNLDKKDRPDYTEAFIKVAKEWAANVRPYPIERETFKEWGVPPDVLDKAGFTNNQ